MQLWLPQSRQRRSAIKGLEPSQSSQERGRRRRSTLLLQLSQQPSRLLRPHCLKAIKAFQCGYRMGLDSGEKFTKYVRVHTGPIRGCNEERIATD
jgi:hypothetical protein